MTFHSTCCSLQITQIPSFKSAKNEAPPRNPEINEEINSNSTGLVKDLHWKTRPRYKRAKAGNMRGLHVCKLGYCVAFRRAKNNTRKEVCENAGEGETKSRGSSGESSFSE